MRVQETTAKDESQRKKSAPHAQKITPPESYFRWSKKSKVVVSLDIELNYIKKRIICGNEISLAEFEKDQQKLFNEYQGKDWYDFHPILFAWRGGAVESSQNTFKKFIQELNALNVALPGNLAPCNLFDMIAMSLSNIAPNQTLIGARDFSYLTEDSFSNSLKTEWKIESNSSALVPFGNRILKPRIKKCLTGGNDMYVRAFSNYWYVCKFLPRH